MQAESICANIEGLDTDTFISVDYLPCDVSPRSRSQDAISIVELGKQLLLSAKNGDTETVRELMCRGAPFTSDWLGTSALHLAAQNNHVETAEILLRAGMSKDARTKVDKTPLHMAAYEGHYDMVQLLLYHGADVDSRDMLRMTPLHWAVEREHIKVMHILLEYGADVGAISKFDKTPVSLALEHNRLDLVDILQREREIITIQAEQQNQASSTEIEIAAQNLMQLEEVEEQQRFETPQQSSSLKRSKFAQNETKPRMIFQRIHISPSNANEQEKETENIETIEINDITNSKKRKTSLGNINKQFRLLEAHGITMIPVEDESSIVENAMESGRTVVLTEAGKLALNSMKNSLNTQSFKIASRRGMVGKVITLKANPILSQNLPTVTSRAPNILKRSAVDNKTGKMRITIPTTTTVHINEANNLISSNENISLTSSTKISQTKLTEPIILQLDDEIEEVTEEDNPDDCEPMDIAILNKQLAEAQRLAAEYFKQYKKKEQEAEIYKQRLKNITAQRASK